MYDVRISQLTLAKPLSGAEYIPLTQRSQYTGELTTVYVSPSALKDYILGTRGGSFCPVGSITAYACPIALNSVPTGWLMCDGKYVDCAEYAELFSKIGITYGGDGVKNFQLPDLRGRLIAGYCSTNDYDTFDDVVGGNWQGGLVELGLTGGKFRHKLTSAEIPINSSNIVIPQVTVAPKVVSKVNNPIIYSRGPEQGEWMDKLNLSMYGDSLPSELSLKLNFTQCEVKITNSGAWQVVGSTGSNNSIETAVTVRPNADGGVYVHVVDRNWGAHTLTITANVPLRIKTPQSPGSAIVSSPSNTNTLFNITQPYIVMNYIIKC
jgi:microcystin-dependent protein